MKKIPTNELLSLSLRQLVNGVAPSMSAAFVGNHFNCGRRLCR